MDTDLVGREPLVSLDLLALGEGYPATGKLLVEKAAFRADAEEGFLPALVEKADGRPYNFFNIEESISTTIELVAQGERRRCVSLTIVSVLDIRVLSVTVRMLYFLFCLHHLRSLTTMHCHFAGHAASVSPGHVEDYLRSLAAQKEPTLSTPSEKPAFVCSICPLGKRFVVSRITVICKFDGPVGHRQRGLSHATVTSPPSSPEPNALQPANHAITANLPVAVQIAAAGAPSAGAMATTVTGATTRVTGATIATGATGVTTVAVLPKASR